MTNTNNSNNERKTTIKGFIINIEEMTKESFEVVSNYVRSEEKAAKMARELLKIDDANVVIKVSELVQDKAHKTIYNNSKLFERAISIESETVDDAKSNYLYDETDCTIAPITYYEYECAYWAYDKALDEYTTDYIIDNSPLKMTAVNMRQFLTVSAHNLCGYEILAIHNAKRTECKRYAIIRNDELESCIDK